MVIGATLVSGATAGFVVVSNGNPSGGQYGTGNSFGSLAQGGGDLNNALEGVVVVPAATTNALMAGDFLPPPRRGATGVLRVRGAPCYVYLALRRKIAKYIAQMERMYPKTHSDVGAERRALRQLPAQSAQVAGFESQSPGLAREKSRYQHQQGDPQEDPQAVGNVLKSMMRYGR